MIWRAMVALALATSLVHANPKEDEARTLFELGQKEMDAKQIDAACSNFERSLQLDPQIGTRLNLADCRERQGKLIEAYQLFTEGVAEAARTKKEGREKYARERAAALAGKLVKITLHVATPELAGLSITLGDHTLAKADWAAPSLAMPGPVTALATAPGHLPFRTSVTGVAGKEVVIEVPALGVIAAPTEKPEPSPAPTEPAKPAPPPEPAATAVSTEPAAAPSHSRVPWIVGGVGAGLVVTSLGVGLHAKLRWDDAQHPANPSQAKSAENEANDANWFAAAGAVAIGVGVVLYLRDRGDSGPALTPVVSDHTVGIALVGRL